jgi:hypothetical protein
MRRGLLAVLAGCSLDESGLGSGGFEAGVDASFIEASVDAPSIDAPDDTSPPVDAAPEASLDAGVDAPVDAPVEAGPILTITGGTYTLLGLDAGVCSTSASTAASFVLTNDRDAAVDLVWVDYTCNESAYGTIASGGNKTQGTYVTHVWRVRDDGTKAFLAGFRLDSANTFAVTVH